MSEDPLAAYVARLADDVPRSQLDRARALTPPADRKAIEEVLTRASRNGPHPGFDELVESYRRGTATWAMLSRHSRVQQAMRERTEELLAALHRRR